MPYEAYKVSDHYGAEVLTMTEEELEQRINQMLDDPISINDRFEAESLTERMRKAILDFEIDTLRDSLEKAVGN